VTIDHGPGLAALPLVGAALTAAGLAVALALFSRASPRGPGLLA
jgi:hypothetical protein